MMQREPSKKVSILTARLPGLRCISQVVLPPSYTKKTFLRSLTFAIPRSEPEFQQSACGLGRLYEAFGISCHSAGFLAVLWD